MTPDTPEPAPLFERFRLVYPSGTVIESYYCGGATLREVEVSHPLATVEVVEAPSPGRRRAATRKPLPRTPTLLPVPRVLTLE